MELAETGRVNFVRTLFRAEAEEGATRGRVPAAFIQLAPKGGLVIGEEIAGIEECLGGYWGEERPESGREGLAKRNASRRSRMPNRIYSG